MTTMNDSGDEVAPSISSNPPVTSEQKQTLRSLLEQSDLPYAANALNALENAPRLWWFENDLKAMHSTYSIKADLARKKGTNKLVGWAELLSRMEKELAADPKARMNFFWHMPIPTLLLFADAAVTKVFGFLLSPSKFGGVESTTTEVQQRQ